jgi:Tfp pilus assembly protein PilO
MKNNKQISSLALLLVAVALYSFWVSPKLKEVKELKTTFKEAQSQIERPLDDVKENVALNDLEKQLLDQGIPTGFDQEEIIRTINNLAVEDLIRINSINFNRTTSADANDVKTVQISINGRASNANLRNFIHSLENSNRVFIVKNLNLSYNEIGNLTQTAFTMNLEAYFS